MRQNTFLLIITPPRGQMTTNLLWSTWKKKKDSMVPLPEEDMNQVLCQSHKLCDCWKCSFTFENDRQIIMLTAEKSARTINGTAQCMTRHCNFVLIQTHYKILDKTHYCWPSVVEIGQSVAKIWPHFLFGPSPWNFIGCSSQTLLKHR